ncbi:MAG TPA: PQQ-binding-like beta-propeller repeat protein [Tepidisphaeraceae bacterium]|jgi:outer membrane protein assembly factor BamB
MTLPLNTRKLILFLSATALFAIPARADFTFVHVTDSHVGATQGEGSNADRDAVAFREIASLNPRPAFVVHTGDVCETATPREYAVWRETLKSLADIPIHIAPGNHDVRWNPLGKEGYRLGTGQPLYHSWDYQNIHFVLLDPTVLLQHWGHFSRAQLDWLKRDLAKVGTDRPIVIGFHHWVGRDTVQVDNEEELLELVAPYNVRLWLQGHGHADLQWNVNGAPAVMAKGLYQGSYHLIEVTKDSIKVKRRTLGKPGGDEIVRDKSVPGATNVQWRELMTVPLAKPAPYRLRIGFRNEQGATQIVGIPQGREAVEYQLNGSTYAPMSASDMFDDDAKYAAIPNPELMPGEQYARVRVTLGDGRQYVKSAPFFINGAVTPAWSTNAGGAIQSHLVRAGDSLYVSTMGNDLVVLDPATGKEQWRFTAEDAIFSTPVIDNGAVYFGSADHNVYAIDTKTHQPKWTFKTGGAVLAGPAVAQGVVCVGSVDQVIYGLDAATGREKWRVKGENMYQSNTATDGRRFFVGGWDNTFRAIDAASGKVVWQKKVGRDAKSGKILFYYSPAISSPAVGEGKVFVTSNDGVLHAFDAATGDIAWEFDGKKLGYSSPLYHDGRVYCAIGDQGHVFCWEAKTGQKKWESSVWFVIYDSSFAYSSGKVFIGSVDGAFNALDAETGKVVWQYRLGPGHVFASPAADEGRVYIGSLSGRVTALPAK